MWRYRLHVPPGKTFYIHAQAFDVPKDGKPPQPTPGVGIQLLGEGEFTFEFRLRPDPENGEQLIGVLSGRNQTQVYHDEFEVREMQNDWIKSEITGDHTLTAKGVMFEQASVRADEPLALLQLRPRKVVISRNDRGGVAGWSFDEFDEPTDGVIIWVDQQER